MNISWKRSLVVLLLICFAGMICMKIFGVKYDTWLATYWFMVGMIASDIGYKKKKKGDDKDANSN